MEFKLCFLTYMARSGSTLLASELDRYKDVGVTIEDDIPDGILRGRPVFLWDKAELEVFIREICAEPKFSSWNINPEHLINILDRENNYPVCLNQIYSAVYTLYFSSYFPQIVVHKKGRYYLHIESVRSMFPKAKFLHLIRDPRALFNSQKKSNNSITGKPMETNLIAFSLDYRKMNELVNRQMGKDFCKIIYYEDIIDSKEEILGEILDFFEISNRAKVKSDYFDKIPEKQKYLHKNIKYDVLSARKTDWQEELSSLEISVLETCLKRELNEHGYILSKQKPRNILQHLEKIRVVGLFFLKYYSAKNFPWFYEKLKALNSYIHKQLILLIDRYLAA